LTEQPTGKPGMARGLAFTIVAALALGGCCHDIGSYVPPSNAQAKFAPRPKPHYAKRTKPRRASTLEVTSTVIPPNENGGPKLDTDAIDAINRVADDELKKKLVICRGCTQPAPDGQLNSIWPTRAAEGYLSIQKTLGTLSLPVNSNSSNGLQ
jgi:hypothetical protein